METKTKTRPNYFLWRNWRKCISYTRILGERIIRHDSPYTDGNLNLKSKNNVLDQQRIEP